MTSLGLNRVLLISCLSIMAGCSTLILPTTDAELRSQSYPVQKAQLSQEYVTAYANLKVMYEHCILKSFDRTYGASFSLDRSSKQATAKIHTAHGALVSISTLKETADKQTELIYMHAKPKAALRYMDATALQSLMHREQNWASGRVKTC